MRRTAFTLIELMAVVTLLGLTAGAVAWKFTENVRASGRDTAINRVIRADRMARLAARHLGRPCSLQLDMARQRLSRLTPSERGAAAEESHPIALSGCRLDRVVAGEAVSVGTAAISYSTAGHSPSYAVRLTFRQGSVWLVFCGMTGQAIRIDNEREAHNLLARLATAGHDAP